MQSRTRTRLGMLALVLALAACALVFRNHFALALVVGNSMRPTFLTGDLVLVNRRAYRSAEPQRGDLVVARSRGELLIKRIVGLPEEEVEIVEGTLKINGVAMPEEYVSQKGDLSVGKGRISEGRFALYGDNRDPSIRVGIPAVVPKDQIVGRVIFSFRLIPGRRGEKPESRCFSLSRSCANLEIRPVRLMNPRTAIEKRKPQMRASLSERERERCIPFNVSTI